MLWAGLILGIGLAYALFCRFTGLAIPCPIHLVTGLWCPGCGVTRMCLALLRLDFTEAWLANSSLLALSPVLALLGVRLAVRYVRTGVARLTGRENALVWCMIALLLAYGVARNLPSLAFLAPG
ncbi:conserved membrane hypothetical protein [uncultured Eubacteriales bacterium]|uniref:DUF2752 domain-containing protein n=1 Tax=uncultured Eubacteriales bacterium TaxID=172733 RepID=A0A212J2Q4_9FIRM|nr:conserved membrane hypothetical protein [uncultured Eubacteriales bacterium]